MSLKALLADIQSYYKDYTFSQKYPANSEYATKPEAIAEGNFDQKSISYGGDRPGGGWSGQPFVTVSKEKSFGLPLEQIGLNNTDMFIRGGSSVLEHIKNDEIRIGKFLSSTQGILFAAQQNALIQSSPVNLPSNIYPREIYSPLNTLVQLAGNAFGEHTNKLGLNPFNYDLPHGQGQNSYLVKTKEDYNEKNTNRLTLLYQSKITGVKTSPNIRISKAFGIKFNDDNFTINTALVSFNRATNTSFNKDTSDLAKNSQTGFAALTNDFQSQTFSIQYKKETGIGEIEDFRQNVTTSNTTFKSFLAKSKYGVNNRQTTFGISDPGNLGLKDVSDITAKSSGTPSDTINLQPLYTSTEVTANLENSDLVPFYFQVVDNDDPSNYTFVHLRAYLDNFGDNFAGNWQSFKYSGRGENFYIYDGFQRNISIGFTVAIESRAEQTPQYEKVNYLASLTAPDYNLNSGFMRGSFVKLTVGDYLKQVPGFINSINYTVDTNVPWDIARDADGKLLDKTQAQILPMIIRVSMAFTPVHNFVPKKGAQFIGANLN